MKTEKLKRSYTKPTIISKAKDTGSMGKGNSGFKTAPGSKSWQYPRK